MIYYRLYVGEASTEAVERYTAGYHGAQVTPAIGQWDGIPETTQIVTLYLDDDHAADALALTLAAVFGQQCVMVVRDRIQGSGTALAVRKVALSEDTRDNMTWIPAQGIKYRYEQDTTGELDAWNVNRHGRISPIF